MLTLFSIPKPFEGHIGVIQRNALANWRRLSPEVEVVLLGSDPGVAEAAREFGACHEPEIAANTFGTPLVSDAFARVRSISRHRWLMYSNADMLYDHRVLDSLRAVSTQSAFLLAGQRWDIDLTEDLTQASSTSWDTLFAAPSARGRLHGPAGIDYMIFPRDQDVAMPPFAVGRVAWDSWLVWRCRQLKIPVIDATGDIAALHQNHDYRQLKLGYQHTRGPERDLNLRAAGGLAHLLTLREASHWLQGGRLIAPPWPARLFSLLGPTAPYQKLLALKRRLS